MYESDFVHPIVFVRFSGPSNEKNHEGNKPIK